MKTYSKTIIAAAAFASLGFAFTTPAHAFIGMNGGGVNGTSINGGTTNGTGPNGFMPNGIELNGGGSNGFELNGTGDNGTALQGSTTEVRGFEVQGIVFAAPPE